MRPAKNSSSSTSGCSDRSGARRSSSDEKRDSEEAVWSEVEWQ